jgi:hypothetical protein
MKYASPCKYQDDEFSWKPVTEKFNKERKYVFLMYITLTLLE